MDDKLNSMLGKIQGLKSKGHLKKALDKLEKLIAKHPKESSLYTEAIDTALEAGESLKACQAFKQAYARIPSERNNMWAFAKEKVKKCNDPVFAKTLLDLAIKQRDLGSARDILNDIDKSTTNELLKRNRVKKQTLLAASHGDPGLKGDLLTNVYAEALFAMRLGRVREASAILVEILERKPDERETMEPFISRAEKSFEGDAGIAYCLGCCRLLAGQAQKALEHFTKSMRIGPAMLDRIAEKLAEISESGDAPSHETDLVLAEALLRKSEYAEAVEVLSKLLEGKPSMANRVVDLLWSFTENNPSEPVLEYIIVEAAIIAKQYGRAMERLEALCEDEDTKADAMAWLERKFNECFLPPKLLLYYGELALNEGLIDRALESFECVSELSPADLPMIKGIVEKHRDADPKIEEYFQSISDSTPEPPAAGEFAIEHFEKSEFHIEKNEAPGFETSTAEPFVKDEGIFSSTPSHGGWIERNDATPTSKETTPPREDPKPHGADTGATDSLEVGGGVEEEAPLSPAGEAPNPATDSQREDPPRPRKTAPDPSIQEHESFRAIEEALMEGNFGKTRELLSFVPRNAKEACKRMILTARYYMLREMPFEALAALKSIRLEDLESEDKREVLIKLANCYRELHMYEAAQTTLLRLAGEWPGQDNVEKLIRRNYSDYLSELAEGAVTLEKSSRIF